MIRASAAAILCCVCLGAGFAAGRYWPWPGHTAPAPLLTASAPRPPFDSSARGARVACRDFIRRSLHNPASAEFVDVEGWPEVELTPTIWRIRTTFRSTNGFGALQLTSLDCTVSADRGFWKLYSLRGIGGR